jgi:hypothetical protein
MQNNVELWHLRMGHLGLNNLKKLRDMVDGVNICQVCQEGKHTKLPYNTQRFRAKRPLERIHSDVVVPISLIVYDGSRYILTLYDYTHFLVTYAIKNKLEVVN